MTFGVCRSVIPSREMAPLRVASGMEMTLMRPCHSERSEESGRVGGTGSLKMSVLTNQPRLLVLRLELASLVPPIPQIPR